VPALPEKVNESLWSILHNVFYRLVYSRLKSSPILWMLKYQDTALKQQDKQVESHQSGSRENKYR